MKYIFLIVPGTQLFLSLYTLCWVKILIITLSHAIVTTYFKVESLCFIARREHSLVINLNCLTHQIFVSHLP